MIPESFGQRLGTGVVASIGVRSDELHGAVVDLFYGPKDVAQLFVTLDLSHELRPVGFGLLEIRHRPPELGVKIGINRGQPVSHPVRRPAGIAELTQLIVKLGMHDVEFLAGRGAPNAGCRFVFEVKEPIVDIFELAGFIGSDLSRRSGHLGRAGRGARGIEPAGNRLATTTRCCQPGFEPVEPAMQRQPQLSKRGRLWVNDIIPLDSSAKPCHRARQLGSIAGWQLSQGLLTFGDDLAELRQPLIVIGQRFPGTHSRLACCSSQVAVGPVEDGA